MTLTAREPIQSDNYDGGWDEYRHSRFQFADAPGAQRAAALLRRAGTLAGAVDTERLPADVVLALDAFDAALRAIGPVRARLEGLKVADRDLEVKLAWREDADDDMDEEDIGVVPGPTERLTDAFEALLGALGGKTFADLALLRNQVDLAPTAGPVQATGAELLAALEAIQGDLLRFERVFVDSLRTSVKAGTVLEGQRVEASKILASHTKR